ncbi:MAG: trypsin-like peptidase domain-containing protein [Armatimonadota bacterium]
MQRKLTPCSIALLCLLVLADLFAGRSSSVSAQPVPRTADLAALGRAFADVAKLVTPAVVNINTTKIIPGRRVFADDPLLRMFFPELGGMLREPARKITGLGSGVIVDSRQGLVVTNNHVIEGVDEIRVILADKREFLAALVGTDVPTDVALIRIRGADLPQIAWADSDAVEVGEWVLAIGSPFGLNQTVTAGIISAKGRANPEVASYVDFLQTDADINPGNSGGALVNIEGELVGINTYIFSQTGGSLGIGFAIPSNTARSVINALLADGRVIRGWLGLLVEEPTSEDARDLPEWARRGLLVRNLVTHSPADVAGVEPGDVIVSVNGRPVGSPSQLRDLIAESPAGAELSLVLYQAQTGERVATSAEVIEQPEDRRGRPFPGI